MAKIIGYMLTWTTYGSWLQGDRRRFVKDGQIIEGCDGLEKINKNIQQGEAVRLTKAQCDIARDAICKEAERIGQEIHAISVCKNHVHLVVNCVKEPIESSVAIYKKAASKALKENGFEGKVWSIGYDSRYCFDENGLRNKIGYVERHKKA